MIRSTLAATSISSWATTLTSGLSALIDFLRRFDLALADPVGGVDDLALEVAEVDDVEVDDADRPDAGGREVERSRRAEPAGADEQRLRAEQRGLALRADLGDQQVAAVALLLLGGEDDRRHEVETRRTSSPGSRPTSRRRPCSPSRRGSGPRTASGRRRRSTGSPACRGRARRPRSAARCSSWRRGRAPGRWPCSHSEASRTSTIVAAPAGRASTSCGGDFSDLGAGLAEEVGVGLRHGVVGSDGRRAGGGSGARAVREGRVGSAGTSRRQAGGRHLQRRSIR